MQERHLNFNAARTWYFLGLIALLLFLLGPGRPLFAYLQPSGSTHTVCSSGCDFTTIQGAVNAAQGGDTIRLNFTSPHTENDIIIDKSISIEGLGYFNTIVQAAANPATAPNRVFFILDGLDVQMRDFTIRHGVASTSGGGIHNQGSDLSLTNMRILYNAAVNGGGLSSSGGVVTLFNAYVNNNESSNVGGGIYNQGQVFSLASSFNNNEAAVRGGGIYNLGQAVIRGSSVSINKISGGTFDSNGGGIYNEGALIVSGANITNNILGSTSEPGTAGGGGIYSMGGQATIVSSFIQSNNIGTYLSGAGLLLIDNETTISHSIISDNKLSSGADRAGGLYASAGSLVINQTTIRDNEGSLGGGLGIFNSSVTISGSTIEGNKSGAGGGLNICGGQGAVFLSNVTISGNEATGNGGGIYICSIASISLANVTVTDNVADADDNITGSGGGIYLNASGDDQGTAHIKNSLIAGNSDLSDFPAIQAHDCYGDLTSHDYNLIGTLGRALQGNPCSVIGSGTGDQIGLMAEIDLLSDNGGPTWTHALQGNSPAINVGNPNGCTDFSDNSLPHDQRGALRIDRCDIGAYELHGLLEKANMPFLARP